MKKLIIIISFLFLISGCFDMGFLFADNRQPKVKPKIDPNSPEFRKTISLILGERHSSDFLKRAAADLALAEYYNSLKKDK